MKKKRKSLEDWQKEDADRLKNLWVKFNGVTKMSQEQAAIDWDIGDTQAIFWQYLNGYIPLNLKVVVKFATGLKCTVREISPTLARQLGSSAGTVADGSLDKDERHEQIVELEKVAIRLSDTGKKDLLMFAQYLEHRDKPKRKAQTKPGEKKRATQSA